MKICFVNKGISVHDRKRLEYLVSLGNDVHLVSFYNKTLPNIPGLTVHQFAVPSPLMAFPIACLMVPKLIRKLKPDIVIGNYLLTYGFYTALSHFHPLLQIAWGSDVLIAPNNPLFRQIVKYSLRHADLVAIDSDIGEKTIISLGYPAEKIVILRFGGIDFNRFNPHVNGDHVRKELGWQDNLIVVCTRQHRPIYGMKYLIEAIPHVIKREPAARFLLIGSGPGTDNLKKQVSNLKIEEYVTFTGMIDNAALPAYLTASDIYVSSSLSDGTSISLLEAMASALPVVVTDVRAILEWVTDGKNGLVVPRKDPVALAQAISKILEDSNMRKTFGNRNYRIAQERASWDDNAKILRDACQSLVKE